MKTYELFVEATEADLKSMGASASQIAMLKKRQAARGKGFSTGDDRVSKTPSKSTPKALPSSSALVKTSVADKATAMVRQKQGGTGKGAISVPKKSGPGARTPSGSGTKTYDRMVGKKNTENKRVPTERSIVKTPDKDPGQELRNRVAKKDNAAKLKAVKDAGSLAKKGLKGAYKGARKVLDKANNATKIPKIGTAQSQDLKGAPRGIYNPK